MQIKITEKPTDTIKDFCKQQWIIADKEHYGQAFQWDPKNFVITAYDDETIIGNLEMHIKTGVAEIDALIIADNHQGSGVGTELFTKAEEIAKEHDVHKLYLFTGKGWKAEEFYKKLGMEVTGELKNHYAHFDYVQYSKFL